MGLTTYELGNIGEGMAAEHLETHRYKVLRRNYRCTGGEVDIVAEDADGTLVFVEVKTRRSDAYGSPAQAVGKAKLRRIRKAIEAYCAKEQVPHDVQVRIDIIAITFGLGADIEHIEGVA